MLATPAKWKVFSVICVPGSPILWAPIAPIAVPASSLFRWYREMHVLRNTYKEARKIKNLHIHHAISNFMILEKIKHYLFSFNTSKKCYPLVPFSAFFLISHWNYFLNEVLLVILVPDRFHVDLTYYLFSHSTGDYKESLCVSN